MSKGEHSLRLTTRLFFRGSTQERLRRHKEQYKIQTEERRRRERYGKRSAARLQHYSTPGHPRGSSNLKSTSTRSRVPFPLALHLLVFVILPKPPSFSIFSPAEHENFVRRDEMKDGVFGNSISDVSDLILETRERTWHSTRFFETARKRQRATPNSQPTGHAN